MHPIVYYIILFLAIGGAGMALANRRAEPAVRRQRWLKYFTYILFTGVVVLGIFYHFISWVAAVIVLAGSVELVKAYNSMSPKNNRAAVTAFLFFSLAATGFILFTIYFQPAFLLFIYFQVLVFDGFCQITGQLFGRHLLAPAVSPAKTVEGLAGGTLFCIIAAMMCAGWVDVSVMNAVSFGLGTATAGFTGDMLASYYKRKAGIKDYSNWLPGQGGFLDRFDSFLVAGATYFLLHLTTFGKALQPFLK